MLRLTKYETILIVIFLITLPLSNPWVRGDGVGYYAFARALLIEHKLDFTRDWAQANTSFRMGRLDEAGRPLPEQYTATGHLDNHFSIGPAILWSPFLISTHALVLLYDRFGGHIAADGFSRPYRIAMALGSTLYGFLSVLISFRLAKKFVPEGWAFLAAIGIWFGSSLPVYMYFNPSWSHATSAFAVALFLWYWIRTRDTRTPGQWLLLGLLAGLMMDCYYMNAVLTLLPLLESLSVYWTALRKRSGAAFSALFLKNVIFAVALFLAFFPTLLTKKIIYGSYLNFGYTEHWYWNSPAFFKVCFSADHGLFSWTPILIASVIGIVLLQKYDRRLALSLLAAFLLYLYSMGCYENWSGISSFGNRFFVSLTSLFVLGLGAFFSSLAEAWQTHRVRALAWSGTALLIAWNLGLIFQWGMHLIPDRGPISWENAAYNQFAVVPGEATRSLSNYLLHRRELMDRIEQKDVNQLRSVHAAP